MKINEKKSFREIKRHCRATGQFICEIKPSKHWLSTHTKKQSMLADKPFDQNQLERMYSPRFYNFFNQSWNTGKFRNSENCEAFSVDQHFAVVFFDLEKTFDKTKYAWIMFFKLNFLKPLNDLLANYFKQFQTWST